MLKKMMIWTAALVITLGSAVFQRKTGPTYPLSGQASLEQTQIVYRFERSHAGAGDQEISLIAPLLDMTAELVWRRFKTNDNWTRVPMTRRDNRLTAALPHQPPAGKLEYHVEVSRGEQFVLLPEKENVVIRFRGDVPAWALVPHVLLMFAAMLFSAVVGLSALSKTAPLMGKIRTTIVLIFTGGFVFGPIVQKYAFGEFWTGFPFGTDLTDNKTLIALIVWLAAVLIIRKKPAKRWAAAAAALVTLIVFMIPHSVHGSELDYAQLDAQHQKMLPIE